MVPLVCLRKSCSLNSWKSFAFLLGLSRVQVDNVATLEADVSLEDNLLTLFPLSNVKILKGRCYRLTESRSIKDVVITIIFR